jgi:hypothetical protein
MDDHTKDLRALADTAKRTKSAVLHSAPMPIYDFEHLGETLSDSLVQAAEELLAEAQGIAEQSRLLAADIRAQVAEQSRRLGDINTRLKGTGEQILEAHKKFTGA